MIRRSFVVATVLATAMIAACAMSDPADTGPGIDPSIPGLDAASGNSLPSDPGRDANANPNEVTDDGGDSNDGAVADAKAAADAMTVIADAAPPGPPKPTAGEIAISEVMFDPSGVEPDSEWIEVHSLVSSDRTLTGLTLKDASNRTHVIGALTIAANAYIVLVRSRTAATTALVPGAATAYQYDTLQLANGATGGVGIYNGATTIASAPYGGWYDQGGATIQLFGADSTMKASWCVSANAWATGADKGTPGKASDCP